MRVGIACGDPAGIGPEIALKAIAAELLNSPAEFFVFGDPLQLTAQIESLKLKAVFPDDPRKGLRLSSHVSVFGPDPFQSTSGSWSRGHESSRAAMRWLEQGARACLEGRLDALVTAPVSKEDIVDAGWAQFVGQTEFLSELAGVRDTVMMLLGDDDQGRWIRVALATVHIPLKAVASSLTQARVELAIRRASDSCAQLHLPRARVAVCGLNPHAGEGGKIGSEEIEMIRPAVNACLSRGMDVAGPLPADTVFHQAYRGDYDAVVAMYHDQGLAPMKMVAFENGVNWTLGLPFIRTSPDHGTAFDIAGRGIASPGSMRAAIRLAIQLAKA